jgi:two-component system, LytTR family, response regulator
MIKALIIDDESDSREVIRTILEEYCPSVEVVGEADNAETAYKMIATLEPNLLFLDIQMQPETGLDLLKKFDHYNFEVIFITAWNKYAIDAIKFHALDYLLKPIDIDDLINAVNKAGEKLSVSSENKRLKKMVSNINLIGITMSDGIEFTAVDSIIRCEANGFYTWFMINNDKKILATKNLKKFEEQLSGYPFFSRVHSSHLININFLKKYFKGESYLLMKDGSRVPVSRTYKNDFVEKLGELGII